jgi:hypothetical protein
MGQAKRAPNRLARLYNCSATTHVGALLENRKTSNGQERLIGWRGHSVRPGGPDPTPRAPMPLRSKLS